MYKEASLRIKSDSPSRGSGRNIQSHEKKTANQEFYMQQNYL